MAVTMYMGGKKISEKDQEKYEVVFNSSGGVIGLQKKEVVMDEPGNCDSPRLHRYA